MGDGGYLIGRLSRTVTRFKLPIYHLLIQSTQTGSDGRFQLRSIAPGIQIVEAQLEFARSEAVLDLPGNPGRVRVELGPGKALPDLSLAVARLDREIAGTVLDAEGRPRAKELRLPLER